MKGSSAIKFSSESSLVSENPSAPESEESDEKICASRVGLVGCGHKVCA